ncbi:MAG: MerR family transcriptional regulator [Flavobacteriia bacterium]
MKIIQVLTLKPIELKQLTKLYYSIGEVAELFSVNTSLIRFWEKEFAIIQPKKSKKGNRMFTVRDIENFNKIYHLVKTNGYTLEGAKKALKDKSNVVPKTEVEEMDNASIISKLEEIKLKLVRLKS